MRKPPEAAAVPVTMPVIRLDVHEDGTMTATVDGTPLPPPDGAPGWRRAGFAQIVDQVTGHRMIPARIEVTEADGSTFTDIITATPRTPPAHAAPPPEPKPEPQPGPMLCEVQGEGFISGEDVAVAVIVSHTDAAPDGRARALLDLAQSPAAPTGEAVLVGRISGTVAIRRLS